MQFVQITQPQFANAAAVAFTATWTRFGRLGSLKPRELPDNVSWKSKRETSQEDFSLVCGSVWFLYNRELAKASR